MIVFISTFAILYGCMNAFLAWRVMAAFPKLKSWRWGLYGWCILMVACPFIGRILLKAEAMWAARIFLVVAWMWMLITFWFLSIGIALALWRGLIWLVSCARPRAKVLYPSPRVQFILSATLIMLGIVWGLVEGSRLNVRTQRIPTIPYPSNPHPLRIVQISDLHLSLHRGEGFLRKVVAKINDAHPDILVCTGDLIDAPNWHLKQETWKLLREIKAPLGKYACLGNHDCFRDINKAIEFHEKAGFRVLRGESVEIKPGLRIAGVDDPAALRAGADAFLDESLALKNASSQEVVILLKHRPLVRDTSKEKFGLQLSGHTHGGQVFPFSLITALVWPVPQGLERVGEDTYIYVSPGTGTWGPPLRVAVPQEVTLILIGEEP
jgi:uncharacterized protein